jgi:Na+-transporting methylmalonyl-CoA/oxaloacetate decarboxylase gamma subunit
MKLKLTILAVVVLGMMSACTQRTCPTYAKEDVKQDKTAQQANV